MEKNPYIELAECLLPEELVEYFEVVKVDKTKDTLDVTAHMPPIAACFKPAYKEAAGGGVAVLAPSRPSKANKPL